MRSSICFALTALLFACGGGGGADGTEPAEPTGPPGTLDGDVTLLSQDVQRRWATLQQALASAEQMTPEDLHARYAAPYQNSLGYDARQAAALDLIQASPVALQDAELATLGQHGFVILGRAQFPSYVYGYQTIYMADLPVYISADSILDAVHRSYDDILMAFEMSLLIPELNSLLAGLGSKLSALPDSATRRDLDLYLSVARGLLSGNGAPTAGADRLKIQELIGLAEAAQGTASIELFGADRAIDASQFKPRGHYEDTPELQQYFRAMMWLGRIDFRLVETIDASGTQVLNRPQVEAMIMLEELFDDAATTSFGRIDDVVRGFVGESDNMTIREVPALLAQLGITGLSDLATIDDETLKRTILENGFGLQQIMSQLMAGGLDAPVPLGASFLLFGQRYVVDSHVLSNVVWDRVREMRMMPDPLDAAFAALGNNHAATLLGDQLVQYGYAGNLGAMRVLVDSHDADFWSKNLYNDWLSALRALSPTADVADPARAGMPSVTGTEAWGRRILNTQLASWAELRHDTLLYAKQSYTGGAVCEFPDARVDPYPEFYAALERFAEHGYALVDLTTATSASPLGDAMRTYFTALGDVTRTLREMAESQKSGTPFTAEQMQFVNDAVVIRSQSAGCTTVEYAAGWYARLFFSPPRALEQDPTIADVHTQPTDEGGADVGRILHVATGLPRLMVTTADTCTGPRAYVGVVSSYFEKITEDWHRMTDSEWNEEIRISAPEEVRWVRDLVAP